MNESVALKVLEEITVKDYIFCCQERDTSLPSHNVKYIFQKQEFKVKEFCSREIDVTDYKLLGNEESQRQGATIGQC